LRHNNQPNVRMTIAENYGKDFIIDAGTGDVLLDPQNSFFSDWLKLGNYAVQSNDIILDATSVTNQSPGFFYFNGEYTHDAPGFDDDDSTADVYYRTRSGGVTDPDVIDWKRMSSSEYTRLRAEEGADDPDVVRAKEKAVRSGESRKTPTAVDLRLEYEARLLAVAKQKVSGIQAQLKRAKEVLALAESVLQWARNKSRWLQKQTDATDDIYKKISLIKENIQLLKSMKAAVRKRDKLQKTVADVKGKLRKAKKEVSQQSTQVSTTKKISSQYDEPIGPVQTTNEEEQHEVVWGLDPQLQDNDLNQSFSTQTAGSTPTTTTTDSLLFKANDALTTYIAKNFSVDQITAAMGAVRIVKGLNNLAGGIVALKVAMHGTAAVAVTAPVVGATAQPITAAVTAKVIAALAQGITDVHAGYLELSGGDQEKVEKLIKTSSVLGLAKLAASAESLAKSAVDAESVLATAKEQGILLESAVYETLKISKAILVLYPHQKSLIEQIVGDLSSLTSGSSASGGASGDGDVGGGGAGGGGRSW